MRGNDFTMRSDMGQSNAKDVCRHSPSAIFCQRDKVLLTQRGKRQNRTDDIVCIHVFSHEDLPERKGSQIAPAKLKSGQPSNTFRKRLCSRSMRLSMEVLRARCL